MIRTRPEWNTQDIYGQVFAQIFTSWEIIYSNGNAINVEKWILIPYLPCVILPGLFLSMKERQGMQAAVEMYRTERPVHKYFIATLLKMCVANDSENGLFPVYIVPQ